MIRKKRKQPDEKTGFDIPLGLVLIVVFDIFGAVMLPVLLFTNPAQVSHVIAEAHELPALVRQNR